jgi:hypothetical protein
MGNPAKKNPDRVRSGTPRNSISKLYVSRPGAKAGHPDLAPGVRRNQLYKCAEELKRKGDGTIASFNGPPGLPPMDSGPGKILHRLAT